MKKRKLISLILLCTIALTGCWDKIEIDERSFVLSLGVDKAPEEAGSPNKYLLTFVNPDTAKAEEGKVLDFVTYDTVAASYNAGVANLLQRFSKVHSYDHTKVLILGEELLKNADLVKDILDAFGRGHQFNSSMLVYMTTGKAADIFKIRPKMRSLLAYYITGIADNEKLVARIGSSTFLEFTKQLADNNGDAVIPDLSPSADGLTTQYLGIMKDYKHTGHLNEIETVAYKWLNGKAKGGVIEISNNTCSYPFTYFTFKRRINLDKVEKGKIYLTYNLETEGSMEEYTIASSLMDEEKLKEFEKKLENIIEMDCKDLIKKMQEEYAVDLLGVREYLYKYHTKLYKSIEKDFEEFFQRDVVINVKADVKIRRIGKSQ
ncbi:Ger(x)C family spore germination protein [Lutispora saccharofermentans]|uniref:Ger(X)C family spore germination protein n=1 Tax=Lutispora saccharofermentans TaxID=3024236 RepID=A0ABT1NCT7_9FIRM|nr:Ger(x)C family spore germination protein [Lutispora saccharofermentans]MCQ1529082.1 Ger(x)C family spore germination protein [Lutispora saccharofermentans]